MLEEIEELTNPKVKAGKKALVAGAAAAEGDRARGARRGARRVEQGRAGAPRVRAEDAARIDAGRARSTTLLAHTSLESSAPINLTMVGGDGRPTQKSLRQMLARVDRVPPRDGRAALAPPPRQGRRPHPHPRGPAARAAQHRRGDRASSAQPTSRRPALIERFKLSERQADDILEIRLRQLARLEAIKIEQELKELRERAEEAGRDPRQPGGAAAH